MITLGMVVGSHGFFAAHRCDAGRKVIRATLEQPGIGMVTLPATATKFVRRERNPGQFPGGRRASA
jgi:hypothetical protein